MDINIVKLDEFDLKKITYSKSFFTTTNKKKMSIGYDQHIDIYIPTPIFTNNMDFLPNHKYQYIKLIFNPMLGPLLKFYNTIVGIEQNIFKHVLKHNPKYQLVSIIKSEQNDIFSDEITENDITKLIYLKLSNSPYKIFDTNSSECCLNKLKLGWKFKMLIKIDSIWIDVDKKRFGLNLELSQLKIIQPIVEKKCLLDDYDDNIYSRIGQISQNGQNIPIPPPPPPMFGSVVGSASVGLNLSSLTNITNITNVQKPEEIRQKRSVFAAPSAAELEKIKSSLKKIV